MKKIKKSLLVIVLSTMSLPLWAHCQPSTTTIAPLISIDLSTRLNAVTTSVSDIKTTLFTGNYICTSPGLGSNAIAIVNTFSQGSTTIGFNGGKQFVQVNVTGLTNTSLENIPAGAHPAANLNTQFTMNFTLVPTKPSSNYIEVAGNSFPIDAVIVATDASGLGLVITLLRLVTKLVTFLLTLKWPIDVNDIFIQPVTLIYSPLITTCDFSNRDLTVKLPMVTINTLKTATRPGYTPFSLNFQCNNLIGGTNTSRDISVFLASTNLLSTDKTVLLNTQAQGAKNVGFRIVKAASPTTPVILSDSVNLKGSATDIFKVLKAATLPSSFTVNMGVYYYPYVVNSVTGGAVSSSARLVFSYD
ncbi:fimbrial protein [Klebsiella sp. BIGb0407]|uniref:fimbrial protein n=1 Tax=Klebsiella sp. BIGb0407 TaxID=2940603 RepID=UPI00216968FA|nr:fimbrial protein [Klebsiella sp. BIGb0407]MCS3431270.1 hypothetical protein [Klebsiella sp. BIGb0407]